MEKTRLEKILSSFSGCSVAVIGDLMLDEFYWGNVERISPEAPVPIVQITGETWRPGGAANVAANVVSMGANAHVFGVIGDDGAGRRLTEKLEAQNISTEGLIIDSGRRTSVKTRVIGQRQQMIRIDRENTQDIDYQRQKDMLTTLMDISYKLDGIIVSDYAKGVIVETLLKELVDRFKKRDKFVAIDPRLKNFDYYKNATVITPNVREAESFLGKVFVTEKDVEDGGMKLLKRTSSDAILLTRSEKGITLFERDKKPVTIPTRALEVFDVTGAGDTVISAFSMALATGASMPEAAEVANLAAGVVVGMVGTASAQKQQILNHHERFYNSN